MPQAVAVMTHSGYRFARVLITEDQLREKVQEMGEELARDYEGKRPLLVGILKGSYVFMADLTRALQIPHEIDFMIVKSYEGTESSGTVRILEDLHQDIEDRHVILVEDIVDSGLTLQYMRRHLEMRKPASLEVVSLLDKVEARKVDVVVERVGFSISNEFVVGYGLDYNQLYRNLPFLAVLDPSLI
ncbi:MAG: hypoxanthine phosphoribosyltransferase [Candidatus Krumholzibacteria bacterium]|jgi:hypoxanthine phosphoribosyltransferase|nr:hypoxanthine phosphoribosyltransferase [Candidatus Krumholzibacteria bacterium]